MAPCRTTFQMNAETICDDSTCASSIFLAVADDGTCQKHPHIQLCNEDGMIQQTCPECDEELRTERRSMEKKRRELELQLEQLSQQDVDTVFTDDEDDSEHSSGELIPAISPPRFHDTASLELLKNQITVMQQMTEWMLKQKENEITALRSQVETYQKQMLQKEVENAVLREKLKQQEERMQRKILRGAEGKKVKRNEKEIHLLKEKLKQKQEERMKRLRSAAAVTPEKDENPNVHIEELIVKVGSNDVEIDTKAVQDANKAVNHAAFADSSTTPVAQTRKEEKKNKTDGEETDPRKIDSRPNKATNQTHKQEADDNEPLSSSKSTANDIKFVPEFSSSEIWNKGNENYKALTMRTHSTQKSEGTAETEQTKNTIDKENSEKENMDYYNVGNHSPTTNSRPSIQASTETEQTKNITFCPNNLNNGGVGDEEDSEEDESNNSKVKKWRVPSFQRKPHPSRKPAPGDSIMPKDAPIDSLKNTPQQYTPFTAGSIALNIGPKAALPLKEDMKSGVLPKGIPAEIDQGDCQSINEELTLATGFDPEAYNNNDDDDDNNTFATSTCGEERLDVISKKLADPYGDLGVFTGVLLRSTGMPHGLGQMKYDDDGRTYDGEWRHGRWHGYGIAAFANGDSYEGEYKFDQRHGRGKYSWKDGRVYDGEFKEDRRQGKGSFQWPDGATYEGEFRQGKRHGQGQYNFINGGYYKGGWVEGRYEGFGICLWEDGRSYKGQWLAGMAHGKGVETYPDGSVRHDGEWFEDAPANW